MRGRFISLEGGEGVGKSTQVRRLATRLRGAGHEVVETREPGGSAGAEAIRDLLLQGQGDRWTARSEALLFAAARADHVARTIRPALDRGAWVVSDRFIDSSLAYQGVADGLGVDALMALHEFGSGGLLPDRTILLSLPAEVAQERAGVRDGAGADRIGARDHDYHERVASAFANLAHRFAERIRIVDAQGSAEQVEARIAAALDDL